MVYVGEQAEQAGTVSARAAPGAGREQGLARTPSVMDTEAAVHAATVLDGDHGPVSRLLARVRCHARRLLSVVVPSPGLCLTDAASCLALFTRSAFYANDVELSLGRIALVLSIYAGIHVVFNPIIGWIIDRCVRAISVHRQCCTAAPPPAAHM